MDCSVSVLCEVTYFWIFTFTELVIIIFAIIALIGVFSFIFFTKPEEYEPFDDPELNKQLRIEKKLLIEKLSHKPEYN